jgi:hypothetical protein
MRKLHEWIYMLQNKTFVKYTLGFCDKYFFYRHKKSKLHFGGGCAAVLNYLFYGCGGEGGTRTFLRGEKKPPIHACVHHRGLLLATPSVPKYKVLKSSNSRNNSSRKWPLYPSFYTANQLSTYPPTSFNFVLSFQDLIFWYKILNPPGPYIPVYTGGTKGKGWSIDAWREVCLALQAN